MRRFTNFLILCFLPLLISACSTLPTTFSSENLMKVHQGMSSNEILEMFGEPKNVRVAVCGMPPNEWNCTTWEYGEAGYHSASFTFSGEHNLLILNNFNVDRDQLWVP